MATIPIEVIVQDSPSPEPTPTPSDSGETNIVVPDTGVGTVENGSNGGGIGSATGIILSAIILVLSIGAMVALLIRRQQRRKNNTNTDISKKEKLAAIASGTITILAATVLVGNLVIPATSAATDETNDGKEGELVVDDKITIAITREAGTDKAVIGSIENKSYATVYKPFGYEVAISMVDSSANLYLDGDESSSYYFSPVEDGVLADNTWGYSLDGEAGEYNAVPLADDLAVVDKGATSVTNEEIDIHYGIKVTNDMPAGTYTGELEYTLADTGFPVSLRSMQDMTTDICSSVPTPEPFKADGTTIEDNVPTIILKDVRDNKLYRVAKLADGKCWMTQNLDLQKEDLVVASLDSTNTDNPADGFKLPDSQTSGGENWGINTAAHIYDLASDGQDYYYCSEYYPWSGSCGVYSDERIPKAELGNYYNWFAATAGTSASLASGTATGSICPAGWELPTNDYEDLIEDYGLINTSFNVLKIFSAPMNIVRAGHYLTKAVNGVGSTARLWTSISSSLAQAFGTSFYIYETGLYPSYLYNKTYGLSVRCLAQ